LREVEEADGWAKNYRGNDSNRSKCWVRTVEHSSNTRAPLSASILDIYSEQEAAKRRPRESMQI